MVSLRLPASLVVAFVAVVASLFAQPASQRPALAPSLRDQADAALGRHDTAAARQLYERWLEADPRDESSWYNLACLYALTGDRKRALDAFESSIDAGWNDAVHPTQDSDLDAIRDDPRFAAALERIRTRTASDGPRDFIRHFAPMTSRGTYIVMLPPDYATSTKDYPVCVILHGAGSSELGHGRLADTLGREGVIWVAVRAPFAWPTALPGGKPGFTAGPPEPIPQDDPNAREVVTDYVNWVLTCVDEVQRQYRTRKGKVFLYGHSQGGNLANVVALLNPERVESYFAEAPSLPNERYLTIANARRMKESGVRAFLLHGSEDNVVPLASSQKIDSVLTAAGVDHQLKIVAGDHTVGPNMLPEIRAWVERDVRRDGAAVTRDDGDEESRPH
jgi:predicted esterase